MKLFSREKFFWAQLGPIYPFTPGNSETLHFQTHVLKGILISGQKTFPMICNDKDFGDKNIFYPGFGQRAQTGGSQGTAGGDFYF